MLDPAARGVNLTVDAAPADALPSRLIAVVEALDRARQLSDQCRPVALRNPRQYRAHQPFDLREVRGTGTGRARLLGRLAKPGRDEVDDRGVDWLGEGLVFV